MSQLEINNEKAKAKSEITKSIRDLVTFNITLPLGDPSYKLIHTNKFITTKLPSDFVLENFGVIGQKMNSSDTRFSGFTKNNWYVEAVTVTNDGTNAKMELTLNPFASNMFSYQDAYRGFVNAYTQATTQQNNNSTAKASSNSNSSSGKSSSKLSLSQALDEVGHLMEKKKYKRHTYSDYKNFVKYGYGDCWAGAYFMACQLEKRGVKARILNYKTSASDNHRSVQYKNNSGKWVNFPYKKYNIHSYFRAYSSTGKVIPNNCPKNI